MRFRLVLAVLIGLSFGRISGQNAWIHPELRSELESSGQTECLIILKSQADVSLAGQIKGKENKGRYVYQTLSKLSRESQIRVLDLLENHNQPYRSFWIVNAAWAQVDEATLRQLAKMPEVERILPNPWMRMQEPLPANPSAPKISALEWNLSHIGVDQVWAKGITGTGAVVGGQDTGYDWEHPGIQDQYRGWNGSSAGHDYHWHDAIRSLAPGQDTTNGNPCGLGSAVPCDDHSHGSHTMGIMVGDDGQGNQIGVAPGAKWIGARNMERGFGTPATYIECFQWFVAPTDLSGQNPDPAMAPHVINNSWGCPPGEGCDQGNFGIMQQVIENVKAAGIVVVASAGNEGPNCGTINDPPAIYEASLVVGATRANDSLANFSSRGLVTVDGSNRLKPDVVAPGVGVRSAILGDGFYPFSGTSMAGPHVAGVVALMIDANPALAGNVEAIEDIIRQSAVPLFAPEDCGGVSGSSSPNAWFGHGRLDALAAVNMAEAYTFLEEEAPAWLQVFPNPSDGKIEMIWPGQDHSLEMNIFDLTGKMVSSSQLNGTTGTTRLDLTNLTPGIYLWKAQMGEDVAQGKITLR